MAMKKTKKIERLLFPTEFTKLDYNALESLLVLQKAGLREILLCHIIPRDEVAFVPYGGYLKEEEERLRNEARIRFEDWQRTLAPRGIGSRILIEVGDPVSKILSLAEREGVDLIVAGKRARSGIESLFIGSHTTDILRRSPAPVLVHRHLVQCECDGVEVCRSNERLFERPLIATDWSAPSEKALMLLLGLKEVLSSVIVAHVIGTKMAKGMAEAELRRVEEESRVRLSRYCRLLGEAGIKAEPHLSAGNEVQELLNLSREFDATMIVMGTTGKDRVREWLLGSVSHRLAESSELPTLLVP